MRILGRTLLLLLVVLATGLLYEPVSSLFRVPPPAPELARQLELTARPSTVYFLTEEQWLTFPVISQAPRLRVLTHAGAAPGTEPGVPLRYTLDYELLDSNRKVLASGRYTHETRIPEPAVKNGVAVAPNLYTDRRLAVAAGQAFNVRLEAMTETSYVRLRLQPLAPPLTNVAARVYYEERMSEKRAAVAWERLSQARQERLAGGVVYPPGLLTPQERLNLLERQWQPVGPLGTEPDQGVLFSLEGADAPIDTNRRLLSSRLYIDPDRVGIVPIATAGSYRLEFRPLADASDAEPELELRQVTEQLEAPQLVTVRPSGEPLTTDQTLAPGLLMITPNQPGTFDIWPVGEPDNGALPEPRYVRARVLEPNAPALFRVLPGDGVGTSLRLDLRAYGDGEPLPAQALIEARYRLLDDEGLTVAQGVLEAPVERSRIDRVAATQALADVSDPASFFLRLPAKAVALEITSGQRLLANAYTRPRDLPHRTRVPADYYAWLGDDSGQPGWFLLQPPQAATAAATSRLLHVQSRPPERDPELLSGRYQWQAFDAQLSARGARILVPLTGEERLRPAGLASYFQPLEQGDQTVQIDTPGVVRELTPQLIYLREQASPFSLRLQIGDQTLRRELIGQRGEFNLPPVAPGRYPLALTATSTGTWLMNYRYPDASGYLRRVAFRLDDQPLSYPVAKRGDGQLVGARFYSLGEAGVASRVRVRIRPAAPASGPTREWTHLERLYDIAPPAGETGVGYVLDQQRERISRGQPILINLGADVPDGPVTVEFSLNQGAPGYMVFYQVLPGERERAQGFREEGK